MTGGSQRSTRSELRWQQSSGVLGDRLPAARWM